MVSLASHIRAREIDEDYSKSVSTLGDERGRLMSPPNDMTPFADFLRQQSSPARKSSAVTDSTSAPLETERRKSQLVDNFTVTSGVTEPTVTCVPGYIIEVSDTHVLCWVKVAPEYRVKIKIDKGLFGDIKLVPGVRFDWSPSLRTVQSAIREKELEDDIATLEALL